MCPGPDSAAGGVSKQCSRGCFNRYPRNLRCRSNPELAQHSRRKTLDSCKAGSSFPFVFDQKCSATLVPRYWKRVMERKRSCPAVSLRDKPNEVRNTTRLQTAGRFMFTSREANVASSLDSTCSSTGRSAYSKSCPITLKYFRCFTWNKTSRKTGEETRKNF